ncbi:MAG TPA: hypothetical protein VEU62_20540 [Bryobacterales bacterium]|nr:hypothetical protein [Bryobacterales bacterium]
MTKVDIRFRLQSPLSEEQLRRLADVRSVYGVLGFHLDESDSVLVVEYDATRLRPEEVAGVLHRAGLAALRE